MTIEFTVNVLGPQTWDVNDDNVDVEILVPGMGRYAATFFTVENIASLFKKNKRSGECANGLYLWASDMILVETLTFDTIRRTVQDLIDTDELESACQTIGPAL